jgi:Tfp pilus assembly protein PilF
MEMQTCRQWSAKRQFEQARIPAETVLAIDRSHVEANARMGAILASEGKPDEGEKYLLRAVTLKSESQYANFNYASWLERRGDAAKSLEYFQRAIKLAPSWWEPQLAAGELLLAQNRSAEAVAYLTEAARLAPDDPAIRVRCAKALEAAGKAKARE